MRKTGEGQYQEPRNTEAQKIRLKVNDDKCMGRHKQQGINRQTNYGITANSEHNGYHTNDGQGQALLRFLFYFLGQYDYIPILNCKINI